ncbi:MAG TPA: hypothetical protein VFG68_00830 [Fimbriiglobus sp.]|nr:hypothetical protein [Fimbriiglobus sp.]
MTPAASPEHVPTPEARLAPVMFALAFAYLLVLAGLIHRAPQPHVNPVELELMYGALAILWPVFVIEAGAAVIRRAPAMSLRTAVLRALLVVLVPPMRMAWVHPVTDRVWLPRLGWRRPGKDLLKRLDKAFGGPMLLFAFLILPVLGMEYVNLVKTDTSPAFALVLDLSIALIWVAFALEFVVKVQAAPSALGYMKDRWLDLAIVGLPTLEFVLTRWLDAAPLLRLLRLGRALGPQQIGAMGKAYRLRGLMTKGWHAFLLLEGMSRLTGNSPAKRLRKVEEQIAELEEQIAELRAEADDLRKKIAAQPAVG